jgi:hypothetical protein
MLNVKNIAIASLLLAAGLPVAAQAPRITGLGQLWYTLPMDCNLRNNSIALATNYYNLNDRFTNSANASAFFFRRAEIKLTSAVTSDVDYEIMIDPISASTGTNPASDILQDFLIKYKLPANIEVRVGQFKTLQTLEGQTSSSELLFAERSMLAREFGDVRDRGAVGSVGFGDSKGFNGRFHLGFFNGTSTRSTQKVNDANPQKDIAARLEMNYTSAHHFGAYVLQGKTNASPDAQEDYRWFAGMDHTPENEKAILDNMDLTSNIGLFYRFQTKAIHASAEWINGVLGRRFPSIGSTGTSQRQHLDQAFMGYNGTFAYTFDRHTFAVRYDNLNWNSGDGWYTTGHPYVVRAGRNDLDGNYVPDYTDGDYSPNYTEITLGYTFAFNPDRVRAANIKVNYINRSKNFLAPRAKYDSDNKYIGQRGPQGSDSVVVAFQVSF